jgi:hypothetical protein
MEGAVQDLVPNRPRSLIELEGLVGRTLPLDQVHHALRRAAQGLGRFDEYGACLVTCSDEFQGEVRVRFDRDVARPLMALATVGARRIFAVSNLGGRVEPGAIAIADDHFTVKSRHGGKKLILIPIAAHVGRRREGHEFVWGEIDRFGRRSPSCGALRLLLQPPAAAASVRFPWFDQLRAFFGPERLEALRSDPMCMVKTAVVHAVLQAETALTDVFRDPPSSATRFLIVPMVVVNHEGPDDAIVVGVHDVRVEDGAPEVVHGTALRTTPAALAVSAEGGRVTITSDEGFVSPPRHVKPAAEPQLEPEAPAPVARAATAPAALERLEDARGDVLRFKQHPHLARVYARPILRGLLQGLSVLAPEVALAAMAFEGSRAAVRTQHLRKLLARGPSTEEARRVLHDMEAEIQQLDHRRAQEVLELLTLEHSPLFK